MRGARRSLILPRPHRPDRRPAGAPGRGSARGTIARLGDRATSDDAIDGGDANEDKLPFDPLSGDWAVSLPCAAEELDWVSGALKKHSTRITARDRTEVTVAKEEAAAAVPASGLVLNTKGFLGS